jgi:drug/metabolite transporter (DMT)-like permease
MLICYGQMHGFICFLSSIVFRHGPFRQRNTVKQTGDQSVSCVYCRWFACFPCLPRFIAVYQIGHIGQFKGRDRWLLLGISLFGVLGFTAFMLYGMKLATGVTGSIVMSTTAAVTAILSVIFFKDQVTWKKILALMLAVAGVLVLQLGGGHHGNNGQAWLGMLLIFTAVCCEAGYTLMGKALTRNYPAEEVAGFSALIAVVCFIPFALWQSPNFQIEEIRPEDWLALAAYGLITMGLGSVLWYKGATRVEGTVAASFMGVMPISALVLSYLLLHEKFEWMHLAGFGLVFCGVLLMISVHRQMNKEISRKS